MIFVVPSGKVKGRNSGISCIWFLPLDDVDHIGQSYSANCYAVDPAGLLSALSDTVWLGIEFHGEYRGQGNIGVRS
jgi:hypothetical protein